MKSFLINPQTGNSPALWLVRSVLPISYVAVFFSAWGWVLLVCALCAIFAAESFHTWITLKCTKNLRAAQILAWATHQHAAEVMDYEGHTRYTTVTRVGNEFEGYVHPLYKNGQLRLLRNGFVDPACQASFIYIWRPLDRGLAIELLLSSDTAWPEWHSFAALSHHDKIRWRREALST